MAGLEQVPSATPDCCSTQAQSACCEPTDKAECCGESASGGACGCWAGASIEDADAIRESVRARKPA
jgi:arsenite methyltransferase